METKTTILSAKLISEITDKYINDLKLKKLYIETKKQEIEKLEKLIEISINQSLYKMLYKPEYGNYNEFVNTISDELRRRNACEEI